MTQYWQIQCPSCLTINYYRVHDAPAEEWLWAHRKWPILHCKCRKAFTHLEVDLCVFTVCERIPDSDVSPLAKRQAADVTILVKQ